MADGAASQMIQGSGCAQPTSLLANDQHQFRLIINFPADGRQADGLAGTDDGCSKLAEEDRLSGDRRTAFGGVIAVVEADANDLWRIRNGSEQLYRSSGITHR